MSRRKFLAGFGIVTLIAAFQLAADPRPARAGTRAGFAERDITPAIGMERPGGYHKSYHRVLHDACKVRAAVFDDGRQAAALIGVDALMVPRDLVIRCRRAIEQKCGIAGTAVMIAASHSHSSGPTGMVQPGQYNHASQFVQKLAYEDSSMADAAYLKRVEQAIVDAVCAAHGNRVDVVCGFGSGEAKGVAFNRRFRMRSGFSMTHPGQGNPNIIEPAGPVDPEVGVLGVWNKQGTRLLGCLVNFACHATASPPGISANYIYYVEKVVRGAMGDDVVVVFTAGASGDVTQRDNLSPYKPRERTQSAFLLGGTVGAEAVKALLAMPKSSEFRVDSRSELLKIKRRVPSAERVKQCYELVWDPPQKAERSQLTFAKEIVLLAALIEREPVVDVEVQALQFGPAVFVSNPAEYFCQYGLEIKAGSPFPLTFPVSLANGCVGYVPTEEALGPRGGGYETRLTSYSNLIPTAGRTIAETSIALTKQLKPGAPAEREPHPPFSGLGWTYGNVPPELK